MQKRRRLGRGLEDISHYFISPNPSDDQQKWDPASLTVDDEISGHAVSVIDLFDPHRGALFTSRIAIELSKNDIKTLVVDGDVRFPGIAFTLGFSIPGYSFKHYFQDQYLPSDIIYTGPFGLKLLAPRFHIKDVHKMKMPEVSLMLETLISIEKEIDIVILRQQENGLQPLIDEAIFLIPASHTSMIRVYREVKSFIAGGEGKRIGIVITDVTDESSAIGAYDKIYRCIERYCGIRPYFCGHVSEMATFSISNIVASLSEKALNNRKVTNGGRLFFDRLRYQIGVDNLTDEEVANLMD